MVIKAGNGTSAMFFCVIQPNELRWPGGWGWLTGRFCSGPASSASDSLQSLADQRTCPDMSCMWCLPNAINHPIYQPWLEIILHYPIIPVIGCHRVYIYTYVCVCLSFNKSTSLLPPAPWSERRTACHTYPSVEPLTLATEWANGSKWSEAEMVWWWKTIPQPEGWRNPAPASWMSPWLVRSTASSWDVAQIL